MGPTFLQREFVSDSKLRPSKETFRNAMQLLSLSRAIETRLVPRSHIIQTHGFLSFYNKNGGLPRELPATSEKNGVVHQVVVDSQVY
jgi:hypothetical protein